MLNINKIWQHLPSKDTEDRTVSHKSIKKTIFCIPKSDRWIAQNYFKSTKLGLLQCYKLFSNSLIAILC